jgi:Peptidase A4 family
MGLITFQAPPKDFDPVTASAKTMAKFGLPRRPDSNTEPGLRKLWDRAFARKPTFVQAKLVEDKVWHSRPHSAWKKDQFGLVGNWAGAVVQVASLGLSPPEPANVVFAEWTVPAIKTKPAEPGTQIVGFWVGLGGYNTGQLLQAGTAATITGSSVSYWAWTEWFPAAYKVDNLAVEAGDVVSVLVCAPESNQGFVSMMNHRTNQAISVGVSDPGGTTAYDGSTVEWIVESIETEMPNFGSVTFTQVTAGTQHHTIDLSHGFTLNTVFGGQTLANGKILPSQNEVEVIWDAAV